MMLDARLDRRSNGTDPGASRRDETAAARVDGRATRGARHPATTHHPTAQHPAITVATALHADPPSPFSRGPRPTRPPATRKRRHLDHARHPPSPLARNLFWSLIAGKKAPDNPRATGATTPGCTLSSPPFHQVETLPKID